MYKLSRWASRHVWAARIIIVSALSLCSVSGLFIGAWLQALQLTLPLYSLYAAMVLFGFVFLLYPYKIRKHRIQNSYRFQKTCDFVLLGTTFWFMICIGNQPQTVLRYSAAPAVAAVPNRQPSAAPGFENDNKAKRTLPGVFSKKAVKRQLAAKLRQWRNAYKSTSTGGKIALIALAVLVSVGLFYLIAALSCSLSCSGAEGAAIAVLLVGTGAIVFLLIRVIRRIIKGKKQKKPAPSAT